MALDAAFDDLCTRLAAARESFISLRTTVIEDRPLDGDAVLVDTFGDAAEDLRGWLEEALSAAVEARQAVARPADLDRARCALITCQERFNRAAYRFGADVTVYERVAELLRLGRGRGGEWQAWAKSVKHGLDWCRQPLYDANEALFGCWREVVDRVGVPALTVQTVAVAPPVSLTEIK